MGCEDVWEWSSNNILYIGLQREGQMSYSWVILVIHSLVTSPARLPARNGLVNEVGLLPKSGKDQ